MKEDANSTYFHNQTSSSFRSGDTQRYNGLIDKPIHKKISRLLDFFFSFIFSVSPNFYAVHNVMTFFRLLQLVGPSFGASLEVFWGKDNFNFSVLSIISCFYNIIPPAIRNSSSYIFFLCYFAFNIFFFIILILLAIRYKKTASLSKSLSSCIVFIIITLNFWLHPVVWALAGDIMSFYIFSPDAANTSQYKALNMMICILTMIVSILTITLTMREIMQTLYFRPSSFMSITTRPQFLILIETLLVNYLMAFARYAPSNSGKAGTVFLAALAYVWGTYISFIQGGFVSPLVSSLILTSNITGVIVSLVLFICITIKYQASLIFLFGFVTLWVLIYFLINFLMKKKRLKSLIILDQFLDETSSNNNALNNEFTSEKLIKNINQFCSIVNDGFNGAHPACLNWSILRYGTDRWSTNPISWFLFAKFAAIYPEETQTLSWIYHGILSLKIHGSLVKTIKSQSMMIVRQRETNLSSDLKMKLNHLLKDMTSSKHKLRNVWDMVIQGNIKEMEASTKRAFEEVQQCESEFLHLFGQFPNNRFVSRQYARFAKEILADHQLFAENLEKTRRLQRGFIVNVDKAHQLGIKSYPNLPEKASSGVRGEPIITEQSSNSNLETLDEADDDIDGDQRMILKAKIEHLKIPATIGTMIIRISMFVILFIVPLFSFMAYLNSFITDIQRPLPHIYQASYLRSLAIMIGAFSLHQIYELFNHNFTSDYMKNQYIKPAKLDGVELQYLGKSNLTNDMLFTIMGIAQQQIQDLVEFRTFNKDAALIKEAQNLFFGLTYNYTFFKNEGMNTENAVTELVSIQTVINDFILQVTEISKIKSDNVDAGNNLDRAIVNSSTVFNLVHNSFNLDSHIGKALENILQYIFDINKKTIRTGNLIIYCGIVCVVIVFFVAMVLEIKWIHNTKEEVYRCLTSLPKNVVSNVAENLRVLQKESESSAESSTNTGNTSDMNKQEDNIMKILVTSGNNSASTFSDRIFLILGTIVNIFLESLCIYFMATIYKSETETLQTSAPHLNYLHGAYAMTMGGYYSFLCYLASSDKHFPLPFHGKEFLPLVKERMSKAMDYFNLVRFGGNDIYETPFLGFEDGLLIAESRSICKDKYAQKPILIDELYCYSPEITLLVLFPLLQNKISWVQTLPIVDIFDSCVDNPESILATWSVLIFPIFDAFIQPTFDLIIPSMQQTMTSLYMNNNTYIIIFEVLAAIVEILTIITLVGTEKHIRQVLLMLMHCPVEAVIQTPKIMKILSGDFKLMKTDFATRDNEFFDDVVQNLPDTVILYGNDNKITRINKSCMRVLGLTSESELIGQNIMELVDNKVLYNSPANVKPNINNENNNDITSSFIINSNDNNNNSHYNSVNNNLFYGNISKVFDGETETLTLRRVSDNTEFYLECSTIHLNNNYIFMARDVTQTVRYNTLINEEKNKSDQLLASILPPSLVKRVQQGEKNISFAVQSATIVFMDIVSFTPWCGSLPADKVMMTLNLLFKKFDAILGKYSTMTKIKCIGDCYMGAGGVFSEVNQPSEHAKEVVSFGLDSIKAVEELNQEIGEKLQIRVGINTGGPIVAGVLGIGKPTFEILGPTINMAQQMEHHGIAMQVHVSRSVYELIYGDQFIVKERGTVEVKNGTVVTYLVNRKE